jgi:hypothetical protein
MVPAKGLQQDLIPMSVAQAQLFGTYNCNSKKGRHLTYKANMPQTDKSNITRCEPHILAKHWLPCFALPSPPSTHRKSDHADKCQSMYNQPICDSLSWKCDPVPTSRYLHHGRHQFACQFACQFTCQFAMPMTRLNPRFSCNLAFMHTALAR